MWCFLKMWDVRWWHYFFRPVLLRYWLVEINDDLFGSTWRHLEPVTRHAHLFFNLFFLLHAGPIVSHLRCSTSLSFFNLSFSLNAARVQQFPLHCACFKFIVIITFYQTSSNGNQSLSSYPHTTGLIKQIASIKKKWKTGIRCNKWSVWELYWSTFGAKQETIGT